MEKTVKIRKMGKLQYQWRLYGKMRWANKRYSREKDMAALPFPMGIQLQTVNACQAACKMCPYPIYKSVFPSGRMEPRLFDKIADEIAAHPEVDTFIPMLQNEPFLDPQIFEKVKRFKEKTKGRVTVELVTNGAFLDDRNIARIRESGLDVLDVSLDALSREVYGKVRVGLDYDRVMAGVDRVLNADLPGTRVFVRLIRLKDNMPEVDAFRKKWGARGVPVFIYTANNRTGAVEEFERDMRVDEKQLSLGHRIGRYAFRKWMGHCPIPFSTANILHNGDVLMCVHDWARKEIIGNVGDHTLSELWNGDRMREIRALISQRRYGESPACRDCSLWKDGWF
jgi:radical SAM protein with 4Fe4S-binding SPASM domain